MEERKAFHMSLTRVFVLTNKGTLRVDYCRQVWFLIRNFWATSGITGDSAKTVRSINIDGFTIFNKPDSRSNRALLFVENSKDLLIMSSTTLNSIFAKRFLIDSFDYNVFKHPEFENGVNPVRQLS